VWVKIFDHFWYWLTQDVMEIGQSVDDHPHYSSVAVNIDTNCLRLCLFLASFIYSGINRFYPIFDINCLAFFGSTFLFPSTQDVIADIT